MIILLLIRIDVFSLYPRELFFFKCRLIHAHPCAYVCIINEKTKGKFPGEHHVV